ncbi:MAG: 7TM diverse intracellular signaling domain-containing protein [Oligoflexus sp.]
MKLAYLQVMIILVLWGFGYHANLAQALALPDPFVEGEKDGASLKAWDPDRPFQMKGSWRVVPGQFIKPSEVWSAIENNQGQVIEVGKSFYEIDPERFPDNKGHATYIYQIQDLPNQILLGIKSGSVYTAAEIFWVSKNGQAKSLLKIGQPGSSRESSYPGPNPNHYGLIPAGETEGAIVIYLSNFHHSWGGLWAPPSIASAAKLGATRFVESNTNYLLIGILLFIVFYSMSLYLRRREDRGSLWLAILSAGFALRMFTYIGGLQRLLPEPMAYSWTMKIIYSSMCWGPMFGYYFLSTYFPKQFKPIYAKIAAWITMPLTAFILLTPSEWFGFLGNPLIYVGSLSTCFMCYLITRVFLAREIGGTMCFVGMVILMSGTFLEALSALGLVDGILNAMGYGIVFFLVFQSQIVASQFVQAFRQSELLGRELQKEVDRQTRDIRSILDNIKQGIFTVVSPLQVAGRQYSPFTKTILHTDHIEGRTVEDLLLKHSDLTADQADQINATLSCALGEDLINYEINQNCLPKELIVKSNDAVKVLEVDWNPIADEQNRMEKLLVCIRDVTEIRHLRLEAERNQREIDVLNEIVNIAEDRFIRFFSKAMEYLEENEFYIKKNRHGVTQVAKRLFVNYHTLKGIARTYHFKLLSAKTHEVEHVLSELLKGNHDWNQESLLKDLGELQACLGIYEKVAREKLHWSLSHKTVKLNREDLVELIPHLRGLEDEVRTDIGKNHLATIENRLLESVYTRLQDIVNEASRGLDSIARDLGKNIPEILQTPNKYLMVDDWTDRLHGALTHVFRNSIDHGIEKPEDRKIASKEEHGRIFVRAFQDGDELRIEVQDDGQGLNLEVIEKIAREKGLLTTASVDSLTVALTIFNSGFSTKDGVTEISGRGVGMDALRTYIEEVGGRVTLDLDQNSIDNRHVSFAILIFLPRQAWIQSTVAGSHQLVG